MRPVGILGGMGPEATILLMQKVLAAVPARDDADHVPLIVHQNPQVPSRIAALIEGTGANPTPVLEQMARDLYEAALSVAPDLIVMVLAATAQQRAVESLGCAWAGEIFADRAYNDDATLVDRSLPGAVIHDAGLAGKRMVEMVKAGAIITESGKHIDTRIDTICLHGDTAEAVEIAASVRKELEAAGVTLAQFEGHH